MWWQRYNTLITQTCQPTILSLCWFIAFSTYHFSVTSFLQLRGQTTVNLRSKIKMLSPSLHVFHLPSAGHSDGPIYASHTFHELCNSPDLTKCWTLIPECQAIKSNGLLISNLVVKAEIIALSARWCWWTTRHDENSFWHLLDSRIKQKIRYVSYVSLVSHLYDMFGCYPHSHLCEKLLLFLVLYQLWHLLLKAGLGLRSLRGISCAQHIKTSPHVLPYRLAPRRSNPSIVQAANTVGHLTYEHMYKKKKSLVCTKLSPQVELRPLCSSSPWSLRALAHGRLWSCLRCPTVLPVLGSSASPPAWWETA